MRQEEGGHSCICAAMMAVGTLDPPAWGLFVFDSLENGLSLGWSVIRWWADNKGGGVNFTMQHHSITA
jgi:hypothetical protein